MQGKAISRLDGNILVLRSMMSFEPADALRFKLRTRGAFVPNYMARFDASGGKSDLLKSRLTYSRRLHALSHVNSIGMIWRESIGRGLAFGGERSTEEASSGVLQLQVPG